MSNHSNAEMPPPKAKLVLHDGETFEGYSFGCDCSVAGEVVFSTGMVGYPESLTDPSYKGQILVLTHPNVGNYGIPPVETDVFGVTKYFESEGGKIHVSAVVVSEYVHNPVHWQMYQTLGDWLKKQNIPGLMMVDTRSIVLKLRDMGTAIGKIVVAGKDVPFADPNARNLVAEVSTKARRVYGHGTMRIVCIDMGVKLNTIRCLLKYDVMLIVVSHDHDITTEQYDGLFISNGPGNPQMCLETIRNVRWALGQDKPIFGICMGNQMLCLAGGGQTFKMKYGHRGQNQPCRCTVDNKVVITTQNHGFEVNFKTMPAEWSEYFVNPNDGSNEGLIHKTKPFSSVQFHPEARCGPLDTEYLFERFIDQVKEYKRTVVMAFKPKKVLVLGAGGIVIAQAGEFDYSGSQCLKSLREEGIETVLINPNVATVQTDDELADHIYFVPVTVDAVERVIDKERPDGILLGWGGQTALNCGIQLEEQGILQKYNVRVLGTQVSTISVTEDRELFRDALLQIDEHVARSRAVETIDAAMEAAQDIGFPVMVRAAFCLGGQGSGIVDNMEDLRKKVEIALAASPQVLIEESVAGWKEIEYEVVRDIYDNCITVCNMENFDPMGVHTGESIVVAPSQTLTNDEFHMLRSASIKIIRHLGVVGECNIQYGLDPVSHRYVVIEVNARLSRSSALASKATGYPLAHVAAKVALGKGLFEIMNGVTKTTMACFEPSLDYIVVKAPRWDLNKFNMVSEHIGSMMKSVGEVMAIGRTFEEALQKALRMVDPSHLGFDVPTRFDNEHFDYIDHIQHPTPHRIWAICKAMHQGVTVDQIHAMSKINKFYLYKLENLIKLQSRLSGEYKGRFPQIPRTPLQSLKAAGFSDRQIAKYFDAPVKDVRQRRVELGVMPIVKQIDTVAGEFPAAQNCYLYCTYNAQLDDVDFVEQMYVVLGCGVYRIGNSVEFDYGGVLVARELRRLGHKVILINYNPETVSTDYDECDRLYFEEVSEESVLDILSKENCKGVVISLGGQIVQNMALALKEAGLPVLGTDPSNIDRAEDRNKFSQMCDDIGVPQPEWISATTVEEVLSFCDRVGYPTLVRPSYVLSGSAMAVISSKEDISKYLKEASLVSGDHPVVVSKYYEQAMEYDVDVVAHHGRVLCYSICEHVENAGVHSGDATMFLPPQFTDSVTMKQIYHSATRIADKLDVVGPMNVQFLRTKEGQLRVIEANIRSSRSVPFVSKTLGISFPAVMVSALLSTPETQLVPIKRAKMTHIGCKASMFSFNRLAGADPILGVEMASTGEIGVFGRNKHEVFLKAMMCQNFKPPKKAIFVSIDQDEIANEIAPFIEKMSKKLKIYASVQTSKVLKSYGVPHTTWTQRHEVQENSTMEAGFANKDVDLVIQLRDKKKDFMLRRSTLANISPDYWVRRIAVDYNLSLLTEPAIVKMFCEAYDLYPQCQIEIEPFRHYVPKVYHKLESNNSTMLRRHKVALCTNDTVDCKVLAMRLKEENIDLTCFCVDLGGTVNPASLADELRAAGIPVDVVDLRSRTAEVCFDLVMAMAVDENRNWHLSNITWHILGNDLLRYIRKQRMTTIAHASHRSSREFNFEKFCKINCPEMSVYKPWKDTRLLEDVQTVADKVAYLRRHNITANIISYREHNTICGITYRTDDISNFPPPQLVSSKSKLPESPEFISLTFASARCVAINGTPHTPLQVLQILNELAGRHGLGLTRTREGRMFETPGITLLATALQFVYDVSFDKPTTDLFRLYSSHITAQIQHGGYSNKHTQSAVQAIKFLTSSVGGIVELEVFNGEAIFLKLSQATQPVAKRLTTIVTEEEMEEVFQAGNGSFSDVEW